MVVREHYDQHLAAYYEWMAGDFISMKKEAIAFFANSGLFHGKGKRAIDLGAGHGIYTAATAELGYQVTAIDFNRQLLESLKANCGTSEVDIVFDDLLSFPKYIQQAELILCMGDTIAHLPSFLELQELLQKILNSLDTRGRLVISFRDNSEERIGANRFIPGRADENRIHTCFLEFGEQHIDVTDILYQKDGHVWKMSASTYRKLRLNPELVKSILTKSGFILLDHCIQKGMHFIIAGKNKMEL